MPHLDASAWLKPHAARSQENQHESGLVRTGRQTTNTMLRPTFQNNEMRAVLHAHPKTGYKDKIDPCHRKDRTVYYSEYKESHLPYDEQPIVFRPDGTAVSARRVPGKSLMAPKLPAPAEYGRASRTAVQQHASHFSIGHPTTKDPTHYKTVNNLFYTKPERMHQDPNPQIAAEKNQWNHRALTFLQPASGKGKTRTDMDVPRLSAAGAKQRAKMKATVAVGPKWS
ncbi:hypothetical protein WJX74_004209 [Apatococcus lobatus]|uniref:Uncharacterized protein n=1 Tax=Apatococcus lobatus TaxID=904363 RepID=A0AAW1QI80_9CHLO